MREAKDLDDEELGQLYREMKSDTDYKYSILKELEKEIHRRCNIERFTRGEKTE